MDNILLEVIQTNYFFKGDKCWTMITILKKTHTLFNFNRDVKIDVPDKYGFTGLMQASQKGYTE